MKLNATATTFLAIWIVLGMSGASASPDDLTATGPYVSYQERETWAVLSGTHCTATTENGRQFCLEPGASMPQGVALWAAGTMIVSISEWRTEDCNAESPADRYVDYGYYATWSDGLTSGSHGSSSGGDPARWTFAALPFEGAFDFSTTDVRIGTEAGAGLGVGLGVGLGTGEPATMHLSGQELLAGAARHVYDGAGLATISPWQAKSGSEQCADSND